MLKDQTSTAPVEDFYDPIKTTGNYAAVLGVTEVGLGSLLHGLRIPLSGQFLSLNQIFFLTFALRSIRVRGFKPSRLLALGISSIAAMLKSLSPAGKKITPMMAISMQGFCYSIGTMFGGNNLLGTLVGGIIASLWAFIQPLILYLLIYGKNIVDLSLYFIEKLTEFLPVTNESLKGILTIVVSLKIILSMIAVVAAWYLPIPWVKAYQQKMTLIPLRDEKPSKTVLKGTIKDLTNPLFLFSFVLNGLFFLASEQESTTILFYILRPLVAAFIMFYLIRALPLASGILWLKKRGLKQTALQLEYAREVLIRGKND